MIDIIRSIVALSLTCLCVLSGAPASAGPYSAVAFKPLPAIAAQKTRVASQRVAFIAHRPAPRAMMHPPVLEAEIASPFGHRAHPISGEHGHHGGLDLAAPEGTPIHAVADGLVDFAGDRGTYGYSVDIWHGGATVTRYAHMAGLTHDLKEGDAVRRGQIIGHVGSTGAATASHLHFEVIIDDETIDPMAFQSIRTAFKD